jgi:hypothetical protein
LLQVVQKHRSGPLERIASGLIDAATAYAGGQLQDDAAVLVLRSGNGSSSPSATDDPHLRVK